MNESNMNYHSFDIMIEHYRQWMKLVNEQVKRYGVLHNAKGIVENATDKMQNLATEKYNVIAKKLNNQTIIMQDLNAKILKSDTPLPGKIIKWWQRYNQLIGMDGQLKQPEGTKKIINQLTLSEKEERDNFTQLATAIKDYHVNQNLNALKYKYLSIIYIIASAILAIISLIGSMILNNRRILDIRNTISTAQEKNESLFQKNTNELSDIKNMLQSFDIKFF